MKNKLFLALSVLTMAFSQVNASLSLMTPASRIIDTVVGYSRFAFKSAVANKFGVAYTVAAATPVVAAGILGNTYFSKPVQPTVQPSRFDRMKNAVSNAGLVAKNQAVKAGSFVKSNVQAHPRIATGAGLATVAGLTYLAYSKGLFGKAAKKATVTKAPEVKNKKATSQVVATTGKKAKKAKRCLKRRK